MWASFEGECPLFLNYIPCLQHHNKIVGKYRIVKMGLYDTYAMYVQAVVDSLNKRIFDVHVFNASKCSKYYPSDE